MLGTWVAVNGKPCEWMHQITLCFFPTNEDIWKSSRIMLMKFSPEFLIAVI